MERHRQDRVRPPHTGRLIQDGNPERHSWLGLTGGRRRKDLLAGWTVAAISLPQAMAYALIAGVEPRFGIYSAIVVTVVASIFGSSSLLINGPTNAISLVVFSAAGLSCDRLGTGSV